MSPCNAFLSALSCADRPLLILQLKQKQAEEAAARDAEASAKAEARIKAALDSNRTILIKRRQDFDTKQAENEERRM